MIREIRAITSISYQYFLTTVFFCYFPMWVLYTRAHAVRTSALILRLPLSFGHPDQWSCASSRGRTSSYWLRQRPRKFNSTFDNGVKEISTLKEHVYADDCSLPAKKKHQAFLVDDLKNYDIADNFRMADGVPASSLFLGMDTSEEAR